MVVAMVVMVRILRPFLFNLMPEQVVLVVRQDIRVMVVLAVVVALMVHLVLAVAAVAAAVQPEQMGVVAQAGV
jgi:hypothetical protein